MRKCIDSLLIGGEDVEILIVDDGSMALRSTQELKMQRDFILR